MKCRGNAHQVWLRIIVCFAVFIGPASVPMKLNLGTCTPFFKLKRSTEVLLFSLAERQGFEPWVRIAPYNAFRVRRLRPLSHLSMPSINTKFIQLRIAATNTLYEDFFLRTVTVTPLLVSVAVCSLISFKTFLLRGLCSGCLTSASLRAASTPVMLYFSLFTNHC
jgi:hypothetical protein